MAKFIFENEFSLEVGNNVYTGTLRELTKLEKKEIDKANKSKKDQNDKLGKVLKETSRVQRKIDIAEKQDDWNKVESLNETLCELEKESATLADALDDNSTIEKLFKRRLEKSLTSDDKKTILALGGQYSYERLFMTILEGVREKKEGNLKSSTNSTSKKAKGTE